jgi:hypothetical protein
MTERQALIWAAGFLEGEGTFNVGKSGRWNLACGQMDPEPLHRLRAIFGAGRLSFRKPGSIYYTKTGPKWRDGWWGWEVRDREDILRITRSVLPYMSYGRRTRIPWIREVESE